MYKSKLRAVWPKVYAALGVEDGWDLLASLSISLGLSLLVLGWLVTPNVPTLRAEYPGPIIPCAGGDNCSLGCTVNSQFYCEGGCADRMPDCFMCYCIVSETLNGLPIACGCRGQTQTTQ
ncbi:hypothetical protein HRbin36_02744 [bacterium HR36]|nr:hypothetical protein HRbin36_02744 [bacterium HR36]